MLPWQIDPFDSVGTLRCVHAVSCIHLILIVSPEKEREREKDSFIYKNTLLYNIIYVARLFLLMENFSWPVTHGCSDRL